MNQANLTNFGDGAIALEQGDTLVLTNSTIDGRTGQTTNVPAVSVTSTTARVMMNTVAFLEIADSIISFGGGDTLNLTGLIVAGDAGKQRTAVAVHDNANNAQVVVSTSRFSSMESTVIDMDASQCGVPALVLDRVAITGTGSGSGDVIAIGDPATVVRIDSSSITNIDRRAINFAGNSLTMNQDTIVGISGGGGSDPVVAAGGNSVTMDSVLVTDFPGRRSEEHTSELQSH